jgi:hypothetical protein
VRNWLRPFYLTSLRELAYAATDCERSLGCQACSTRTVLVTLHLPLNPTARQSGLENHTNTLDLAYMLVILHTTYSNALYAYL